MIGFKIIVSYRNQNNFATPLKFESIIHSLQCFPSHEVRTFNFPVATLFARLQGTVYAEVLTLLNWTSKFHMLDTFQENEVTSSLL